LNGIDTRYAILSGQVLILPPPTTQQAVAEPIQAQATVIPKTVARPIQAQATITPAKRVVVKKYQVRPGDTLSSIAQRFDTTVPTLASLNGLKQRQSIKSGMVLSVPSASTQTVVVETASQRPAAAPKRYQVRLGDTLWSIAQRFRTTVPTLVAVNGLKPRQQIRPGQILILPPPSLQEAMQPSGAT
jgi:membrane-bound lytic murein transglycosylase D